MSTAAAMRHEPEERYDPMNRLLDAFEQTVIGLIEHGLEPQLRARLERLLPTPKAERVSNVDFALKMGTVLRALQDINPRNYSEGQRQTLRTARETVLREMGRALAKEAA